MARASASIKRKAKQERVVATWAQAHDVDLEALDVGQRWTVFGALEMLRHVGKLGPLRRVVAYLLAHSGMELGAKVIAAVVGVSDRAIRSTQALTPENFLKAVKNPIRGHQKPKLHAEDAGVIAAFLVANKGAYVQDLIEYIEKKLGTRVDRLTLRRYVKRYGLGVLREERMDKAPLFSAARSGEEPFF